MGIHNLNTLLRKKCPGIFREVHLSNYAYQKFAIDISLFMFKYKTIHGDRWLFPFITLINCLRTNHIHPIFVYDSEAPPEKKEEQERRRESRNIIRDKNNQIKIDYEQFKSMGEKSDLLNSIVSKKTNYKLYETDDKSYCKIIIDEIKKLDIQTISISKEDFDKTKQLFDIIGVSYIDAPIGGEAEKTCSELCINGGVDAVMSQDTDVMAYGTPIFLTKINTQTSTCVAIYMDELLEELELNYDQFRDLCIMCGNDYNSNIPKIGPITSLTYIKECSTIEDIETYKNIDTSILKYKRSRELFTVNIEKTLLPNDGYMKNRVDIDWEKVDKFLMDNNMSNFKNIIYNNYYTMNKITFK